MKIWILGADGLLGKALSKQCDTKGYGRLDADLCNLEQLRSIAEKEKFTHIINCGAYNDVDRAEIESEKAFDVNAKGPENLGILGREFGMKVIHVSTDYVFSGDKKTPYREEDACAPLSIYGKSKQQGEERLLSVLPTACVVRTSWLFGSGGRNFLSSFIRRFQTEETLTVEAGQISRPTLVHDLAKGLLELKDESGLFHFASGQPTSRYALARLLHTAAKESGMNIRCKEVVPAYPSLGYRPSYSALSTQKIEAIGLKPLSQEELICEWLNVY